MTGDQLDALFRDAVAAIDAGDVVSLEQQLQRHPELVRERLTAPGEWVRSQIGSARRVLQRSLPALVRHRGCGSDGAVVGERRRGRSHHY